MPQQSWIPMVFLQTLKIRLRALLELHWESDLLLRKKFLKSKLFKPTLIKIQFKLVRKNYLHSMHALINNQNRKKFSKSALKILFWVAFKDSMRQFWLTGKLGLVKLGLWVLDTLLDWVKTNMESFQE
jgi:hypothetical protein